MTLFAFAIRLAGTFTEYYNVQLIPIREPDTAIPAAFPFIPRVGDLLTTTPTGGNRNFEVVQVYAKEPTAPNKQGDIQILVKDVAIPEIFTES